MARHLPIVAGLVGVALFVAACAPSRIDDPYLTLTTVGETPVRQIRSMEMLDGDPTDEEYLEALKRMLWRPGFTVGVREEAFERLESYDEDGLKRTLIRELPRLEAWNALERFCDLIAARGWSELTPALVRSWARPVATMQDETERPEYQALARLHGEVGVADAVFDLLVESNRPAQQGLRTRCWELLHRIGLRDRLRDLVERTDLPESDIFIGDLQRAVRELGILPRMREEILWIRMLCKSEYAAFWSEAREAVAGLPEGRRGELEMRDIPIVVSLARHRPELLTATDADLFDQLDQRIRASDHHSRDATVHGGITRDRLFDWRKKLTFGDLAAMTLALDALEVQPVTTHMLDYAERDRADRTTEYGGILALDDRGRYVVHEFPPRMREHDQKFIASQDMFNVSYTALFHFHLHVQRRRNNDYAGPGGGDHRYAEATRANCLVLTSVGGNRLNADYYRHGGVQIDLGTIGE